MRSRGGAVFNGGIASQLRSFCGMGTRFGIRTPKDDALNEIRTKTIKFPSFQKGDFPQFLSIFFLIWVINML